MKAVYGVGLGILAITAGYFLGKEEGQTVVEKSKNVYNKAITKGKEIIAKVAPKKQECETPAAPATEE